MGKPATSSFTAESADGMDVLLAGAVPGDAVEDGGVLAWAVPEASAVAVAALLIVEELAGISEDEQAANRTTAEAAAAANRLLRVVGTRSPWSGVELVMAVSLAAGAVASRPVYPCLAGASLQVWFAPLLSGTACGCGSLDLEGE